MNENETDQALLKQQEDFLKLADAFVAVMPHMDRELQEKFGEVIGRLAGDSADILWCVMVGMTKGVKDSTNGRVGYGFGDVCESLYHWGRSRNSEWFLNDHSPRSLVEHSGEGKL